MKPKRVPIAAAKRIAKDYGYDQVVILTRKTGEDGAWAFSTYGVNKAHCDAAAKWGRVFNDLQHGKFKLTPTTPDDQD